MKKTSSKYRGFTLVEMLVVLGILAMLSAVGMSVVSRARERGRMATCISNLHQIHLAREMYKQDYEGKVPVYLHQLYPAYLKDKRLLVCPNDPFVDLGGWEHVGWQAQGTAPNDGRPPQSYAYVMDYDSPLPYDLPNIPPADRERILETAGYAVCQLHGELLGTRPTKPNDEEFPSDYKGLTLRLRRDGSVHTAYLPKNSGQAAFFRDER